MLEEMGAAFILFTADHRGERFPPLSKTYGQFTPELDELYPTYIGDGVLLKRLQGKDTVRWAYIGRLATSQQEGLAFLDAYATYGAEAIHDQDLKVPEGQGTAGTGRILQLRAGIERFIITDINDAHAGDRARSHIPVMWELPGTRNYEGGHVLYLDGHVEWLPYPGPFPMTEAFNARLEQIMIDAGTGPPGLRGEVAGKAADAP